MISAFESTARISPDQVFFTFVNAEGAETAFTYRQTRLIAATLARYLRANGVGKDDVVVVDLPNSPEYVFLLLAAGYGSFTIACTEQGITHTGLYLRLFDFNRDTARVACTIDIDAAEELMAIVGRTFTEEQDHINTIEESVAARANVRPRISMPPNGSGPLKRGSGPFRRNSGNLRSNEPEPTPDRSSSARRSGPTRRSVNGKRSSDSLGRGLDPAEGRQDSMKRNSGPIMGEHQDALEDAVHFAEREAHLFSDKARAVILFTAGVAGKYKLVPLTWQQIASSANSANHSVAIAKGGVAPSESWQVVLPFSHAIGLQTLARAIQGRAPLRVYERFDAERILRDTENRHITSIALTDAMLQEMIDLEECRSEAAIEREHRAVAVAMQEGYFDNNDELNEAFIRARASVATSTRLSNYSTILLIGLPLNPDTVERALTHELPIHATYGMAETAGIIADTTITASFTGGLRLLHGYSARIIEPDQEGFGRLAVHGAGVFSGYLNARAAFTIDGYFLTGDAAALHNGSIYVREQAVEVFAGKNGPVYPREIAEVLRELPDVSDAYVFGVPDLIETPPSVLSSFAGGAFSPSSSPYQNQLFTDSGFGQANGSVLSTSRPVAMVERASIHLRPDDVYNYMATRLPDMDTPRSIAIVDELPRHPGTGMIDRDRVEAIYERRLEIVKVVLHHIHVPFRKPVRIHGDIITHRDAIIVEVIDHLGRTGLGECVPSTSAWTDAIGLEKNAAYLQSELVPTFIDRPLMHPREASALFATLPRANEHRFATTSLGMALWDLYGKVQQRPFWSLLNEEYERLRLRSGAPQRTENLPRAAALKGTQALVTSSRSLNLGSPERTLEVVENAVRAGYRRIKVRITPEHKLSSIRAVQERFPDLLITLDGNRSFSSRDIEKLRGLDQLHTGWIEEPLNQSASFDGRTELVKQLSALQRTLTTPVSIDESFTDRQSALRVLDFHDLRCIGVKLPKFGSIENALSFVVQAQTAGRALWMGAMFDSAILKRAAAAFETLPGIVIPGDIDSPLRVYTIDITEPPYTLNRGYVVLNADPYAFGFGCDLNDQALAEVLTKRTTIE